MRIFKALVALLVALACMASTSSAATSITDRLSPTKASIEVTSEPTGTGIIHVAIMQNTAAAGLKYLNLPATQTTYTPPSGDPVVDVQAMSSSGSAIGGWAGRLQTIPGGEVTPIPVEEPKPRMAVGVDGGGWDWSSAVSDIGGAVKYLRSSYSNYNSDSQVSLLASHGIHLLPLFSGSPTASGAELGSKALEWFRRYGQGGTFWAGKTDLGATTAEIVNEPGNPFFWGSGATSDEPAYAAQVERVHTTLASLPHPPILLVSFDGGYEGDSYGRTLIHDDPHLLSLGLGWTVHPYGGHGSTSALGNRPRVTEAYEATKQPVYVTEVGWPTCGATGDSLNWSESQQAENISSFVKWSASLGYVSAVVNFNYADYTGNCYGIVKAAGSPHKIAYGVLHALAETY